MRRARSACGSIANASGCSAKRLIGGGPNGLGPGLKLGGIRVWVKNSPRKSRRDLPSHAAKIALNELAGAGRTATWADIDGDGKLELVCATPALWRFKDGKFIADTKTLPLSGGPHEGVAFFDANGDGIPDLVVPTTEDASFGAKFNPALNVYQWDAFDPTSPNYLKATPWVAAANG